MAEDNELNYYFNLQSLFKRQIGCDYDTVTGIAENLIGLSELVRAKARKCHKDENISMLFFIANSLRDFSDKLYDSEFYCYVKKKEPTPTTTQE